MSTTITTEINIKKLSLIPIGLILTVLVIYILRAIFDKDLGDPSSWGQFGDFFGGVLNPILSTVTFLALLFTINVQLRQLKTSAEELRLSREELELTREELRKSAAAQHESQLALNKQALIATKSSELNSINFLINQYSIKLEKHRYSIDQNIPASISEKLKVLDQIIEETYSELIEARN